MPRSGVLEQIAARTGQPVSAIKAQLMRNVMTAVKQVLPGKVDKATRLRYVGAALRAAWRILKSTGRVPTVAEIASAIGARVRY